MSWEWKYLLAVLALIMFSKILYHGLWPTPLPDWYKVPLGFAILAAPAVFLLWVLGA
jgi:hypothetical protein